MQGAGRDSTQYGSVRAYKQEQMNCAVSAGRWRTVGYDGRAIGFVDKTLEMLDLISRPIIVAASMVFKPRQPTEPHTDLL